MDPGSGHFRDERLQPIGATGGRRSGGVARSATPTGAAHGSDLSGAPGCRTESVGTLRLRRQAVKPQGPLQRVAPELLLAPARSQRRMNCWRATGARCMTRDASPSRRQRIPNVGPGRDSSASHVLHRTSRLCSSFLSPRINFIGTNQALGLRRRAKAQLGAPRRPRKQPSPALAWRRCPGAYGWPAEGPMLRGTGDTRRPRTTDRFVTTRFRGHRLGCLGSVAAQPVIDGKGRAVDERRLHHSREVGERVVREPEVAGRRPACRARAAGDGRVGSSISSNRGVPCSDPSGAHAGPVRCGARR